MAQIVEYLEKFAKESKIIRSDDRGLFYSSLKWFLKF